MRNAVPIVVALLLVCALPATVAVADSGGASAPGSGDDERLDRTTPSLQDDTSSSGIVDIDGRPNQLGVGGNEPASYVEAGPDLGTALAVADDDLRESATSYHFDDRYENWTNAERQLAIEGEIERIESQTDELAAREKRAVRAHAAGNSSDRQLLLTLVRLSDRATVLHEQLSELESRGEQLLGYDPDVRSIQAELAVHRSELRTQLLSDVRGMNGDDGQSVSIETADHGVSIALANDAQYVRETSRYDNRDTSREDQIAADGPIERFEELYPWVYENTDRREINEFLDAQLYEVDIPHQQGRLHTFLDGGTGSVFREVHSLHLEDLPKTSLDETWHNDSVEVSINETAGGSPIEVAVRERSTGDPIDARLSFGEAEVARTGEDGTAWVIPPAEEYVVTAETDDAVVNATVSSGSTGTSA